MTQDIAQLPRAEMTATPGSQETLAHQGVELRHLRYLVAVADAGTFTHAAERMFIAQPTLSQQIRRLEEMVGTPLLYRRREGVELTATGNVLLEESRTALSLLDHGVSRSRHAAGLGRPRLSFVLPPDLPERLAVTTSSRLRSIAAAAGAGRELIDLDDLADMAVIGGPRRVSPATYDAWRATLRARRPRFEFTDPPFRHSLPMTLAFAAAAGRPTAVVTGPLQPASDQAAYGVRQPVADSYGMVRVGRARSRPHSPSGCAGPASGNGLAVRRNPHPFGKKRLELVRTNSCFALPGQLTFRPGPVKSHLGSSLLLRAVAWRAAGKGRARGHG
jgi:DNA-binding transcriptional LysR family regulator